MTELTLKDLQINLRLQEVIPPQTATQNKQLEENMIEEGGAHDPLLYAMINGKPTLIDGHHRYFILFAHPELKYRLELLENISTEDEAKEYIIKNQLGKHNLNPKQQTMLQAELLSMRKHGSGGDHRSSDFQKSQFATFEKDAADDVAKELGVNRATVFRAANFKEGLDAAENAVPGIKRQILTNEVKTSREEVAALRKLEPEEVKERVVEMRERKNRVKFPSDRKEKITVTREEVEELRMNPGIARNKNESEYTLESLLEELRLLNEDFISKYQRVFDYRRDVVTDNSEEVQIVMEELITEFENLMEVIK